jgi:hypothetical protein
MGFGGRSLSLEHRAKISKTMRARANEKRPGGNLECRVAVVDECSPLC